MNKRAKPVRIDFAPENRFTVEPARPGPFRAVELNTLERLKAKSLRQLLRESTDPEVYATLQRAANDAASLAWATDYPLLFFPALLDELTHRARHQAGRQKRIRRRSRSLIEQAV
ncbi:MAG: hypothetical protein DME26_05455 [Verrucomicrobia bacterium]|nr:MAG: hypothetical protein DME26_05455 [Verrucomicrobiota bacterium]